MAVKQKREVFTGGHVITKRSIMLHPRYKHPLWAHLRGTMMMLAAYQPTRQYHDGVVMTLKRGQFISSRSDLAEKSGLKPPTVQMLCDIMEHEGDLEYHAASTGTLYTLLKYDEDQNRAK
jgi:hypothetical protein